MESALASILVELRAGFDAVNERLDRINGTVRQHGQQIAVLENQAEGAYAAANRNTDKLDDMQAQFLMHRAKCPFDQGVRTDGAMTSNDQAVLQLARQIRNRRALTAAGVGGGIVLVLLELIPRLLDLWAHATQP